MILDNFCVLSICWGVAVMYTMRSERTRFSSLWCPLVELSNVLWMWNGYCSVSRVFGTWIDLLFETEKAKLIGKLIKMVESCHLACLYHSC